LKSELRWTSAVTIAINKVKTHGHQESDAGAGPLALTGVTLAGDGLAIALRVPEGKACLEAVVDGAESSARIVPLGDGSLGSLIGEELGVRTRDLAFERALVTAREIPA
jgi:hypothetical protein